VVKIVPALSPLKVLPVAGVAGVGTASGTAFLGYRKKLGLWEYGSRPIFISILPCASEGRECPLGLSSLLNLFPMLNRLQTL
jgi:hypothetical protein